MKEKYKYFLAILFGYLLTDHVLEEIFGQIYKPWEFLVSTLILIVNIILLNYFGEFIFWILNKLTVNGDDNDRQSNTHTDGKD